MLGGELHYWRVPQGSWERALEAAKGIGVDTIGTYVPWNVHEVCEGRYDFGLLEDFLETVRTFGLTVFIRPGPYICAEWHNLGTPDHALPFHRLHPVFKAKAEAWIEAVMAVLRPHLKGLIILLQADNEIDPLLHVWGEDLSFSSWLRDRYGSIERLNAAWGSDLCSFEEALPWFIPDEASPHARDGARYRYDLATSYARWVVEAYRRHGCTVPIVLNTWPGVDAQNWRDLREVADLFGIDPYPSPECREDHRYLCERLRLLRAICPTPLLTEWGCGIWEGAGRVFPPDHYRLLAYTALLTGVRGWNWYMLVERDHWHGSPIAADGSVRTSLADVLCECAAAFRSLGDAPSPEVSCAVTWSWPHEQARETRRIAHGQVFGRDEPSTCARVALRGALHELGIEYDLVEVDRPVEGPPIVFHAGGLTDPRHLWDYVDRGGHLVLFQDLLRGCARPAGTSHPYARNLETSLGFSTQRAVFSYRTTPGTPITAVQRPVHGPPWMVRHEALAIGRSYTIGYHQRRGGGTVTVLGCWPSREAILALHRFLGVEIPALPKTPGILASLRGTSFIAVNPGEATEATIEARGRLHRLHLPRCGGAVCRT